MVSAFFGLDNAIQALRYKGADGMPVTFSKRVADPASLEPEMFTVISRSGKRVHPLRVTTRPANAASKRHTVLLIGEFGNESEDPPVKVEVTGQLILAGGDNAQGLSAQVTPLEDGPSLVLAYAVSPKDQNALIELFYLINPSHFKMDSLQMQQTLEKRMLQVDYASYQEVDKQIVPENIRIIAVEDTDEVAITMEFKSVSLNDEVCFPFNIPSGYKEIVIK